MTTPNELRAVFRARAMDGAQYLAGMRAADEIERLTMERDEALARSRKAAQALIEACGSVGPENVDDAAKRAAARVATLEAMLREASATGVQSVQNWERAVLSMQRIDELLARNTQLVLQNRLLSIRTNVEQFHRVFEQPVLERPQVPPEYRVRHRLRLIAEEFFELLFASLDDWQPEPWLGRDAKRRVEQYIENAPIQVDLPEFADALCDIDYVVEGTRLEFGIDGTPVLEEVQRANLAKAGMREDGKIAKPEGWVPPDVKGVLKKQGWTG